MEWDFGCLTGPDGADWRVPTSELEMRQNKLVSALSGKSAWVNDPVDMYWLVGNRQAGGVHFSSDGIVTQYVRNSLERARYESGGNDSPHDVVAHPRMSALIESVRDTPALQLGRMPASDAAFIQSKLGNGGDCTQLLWTLRETKSDWEIERMRESGEIQRWMFEAIDEIGCEGVTEIDLAAAADEVSRAAGFGGFVRMRKWPMDCDRVVVASGRAGSVPTFFDSAVGGAGTSPLTALGAGFNRVKIGEPVLVDIVHVHRGYVADMTRMFSVGPLADEWMQRLEDMGEIAYTIREILGRGEDCSNAWERGSEMASEMGYDGNLMGMQPEQARFLGHSIGLELDETPVVAAGFNRPLPIGGTMAIEPKVIYPDGAIGVEDCWVRTDDGISCLSSGSDFPMYTQW
ncbi:MAG: M24 family metallopeptidase [Candidatus Thermoplasmatota archaeon]|nr:M24 family metallopeptidase [Candidatus Thermoplasmatota archaeon]